MKKLQCYIVVIALCLVLVGNFYLQKDMQKSTVEITEPFDVALTDFDQVAYVEQQIEVERMAEGTVTMEVLDTEEAERLGLTAQATDATVAEPSDIVQSTEVVQSQTAVTDNDTLEQLRRENMIMTDVLPLEELYTGQDADEFFSDAIFVGDSVTVGLSNYYTRHSSSVFADTTQFLAKVGCSAKMCISSDPTSKYASYMPSYNGRLCKIEDGVALSGAKKIFIDYGLNDLTGSTPAAFVDNFSTLLDRIQDKSPDAQIYVISTTYVVDHAQKGMLTNGHIRTANELMLEYCKEKGYGFLNLADYLSDATGGLCSAYSSDQYVHQNASAYAIWVKVLRQYAWKQMEFEASLSNTESEQSTMDPVTGFEVDSATGYLIDPITGYFIDPATYTYVDPVPGAAID